MQALEEVAKQEKAEALQERESADRKVAEARAEQESVEEAATNNDSCRPKISSY